MPLLKGYEIEKSNIIAPRGEAKSGESNIIALHEEDKIGKIVFM